MNQYSSVYENMSQPEIDVCSFISSLGLWWQYEQPVFVYDDKQRPRVWTPDFYIPELGLYIEVANSERGNYDYRKQIYLANRIPIVFVTTKNFRWQMDIYEGIYTIHQQRWDYIKRMNANIM